MRFFTRQRPVGGRLGRYTWLNRQLILILALAIAAFAGGAAVDQTVGPTLEQAVHGQASVTAQSAVVFDTSFKMADTSLSAGFQPFDQFVGVIGDNGTSFTAAMETQINSTGEFNVPIANRSNANAAAILTLDVPAGIDVNIDSDIQVTHARIGADRWLLTVGKLGGNVYVDVRPKAGTQPGEFKIKGQLTQFAG